MPSVQTLPAPWYGVVLAVAGPPPQCIRARRRWTKPGQEITPPVAGTSSSSAEVLCPVRPTGLMGGVIP